MHVESSLRGDQNVASSIDLVRLGRSPSSSSNGAPSEISMVDNLLCPCLVSSAQVSASEIWRFPAEDHADAPMGDALNLAEICTQTCEGEASLLRA